MEWMFMPFRRFADFSGRSRRMEYWMFALLNILVAFAFVMVAILVGGGLSAIGDMERGAGAGLIVLAPFGLYYVAILIPSLAVQVRRLHDRDMSGWWLLLFYVLSLIPVVGFFASIALLVLAFLPGTDGDNRFGPDPKNPQGPLNVFD